MSGQSFGVFGFIQKQIVPPDVVIRRHPMSKMTMICTITRYHMGTVPTASASKAASNADWVSCALWHCSHHPHIAHRWWWCLIMLLMLPLDCSTAWPLDCLTARLFDHSAVWLLDCSTAQLLDRPTARLFDQHSIVRPLNHLTAWPLDCSTTQLLDCLTA